MTPQEVIDAWHRASLDLVPDELAVWDGHTHTGHNDPDGFTNTPEALLAALEGAGHAGAIFMTSADPGGYAGPNARVLDEAEASDGRLLPLFRVDPHHVDTSGIEQGLEGGHVGLKFHPRSEAFSMAHPMIEQACRVAAANGVPILVHSGRGIPSLRESTLRLLDSIDGLRIILAHCGISDLARMGPEAHDHPGLYFDCSWWDATDRLALAAWVAPGRILYASDTPYGEPGFSFVMAARVAAAAGYDVAQMRAHFGGTLLRLVDRQAGDELGPAKGDDFMRADAGLLRVHASLHAALGGSRAAADPLEPISLARAGCDVDPDVHDADVYRAIAATLDAIDHSEVRTRFRLLVIAAVVALTPQVPVPDLG